MADAAPQSPIPKSKFVHLHVHSHYSLLNALPKTKELAKTAKKMGMHAIALTDDGNLYGAIEFYKDCQKEGVKPIIGVDAFVAPRTRHDKEHGVDNKRTRLILLAKDIVGYKNLIKLVTQANLEGFYYKPRIDKELIEAHRESLICISPSFSGAIVQALKMHDAEKAESLIAWHKEIYGPENFFIEITKHPEIDGHDETMRALVDLARKTNTQIVAAHDVYYMRPDDRMARKVLNSIASGGREATGFDEQEEDFSFITPEKAMELFNDLPDALENSVRIADMCNLDLKLGKWFFPDVKPDPGKTHDETLRDWVYKGIEDLGVERTDTMIQRVEYELKVIKDKGYAPYFLTVSDLLRYAHENHILTTIRGSVAGSMVTYLARITNVNPLEYKLPFERFLNPERPSAPDIDMDYADNRRDEVISYARNKYGADKVAQIGTFGTMMARGAVRDTARALGFPYASGDRVAKMIPMGSQGFPMTIDKALETVPELKEAYDKEPETKEILDMARKIEGCARHISIHAAGVVISPDALTEHTPLQYDPKGEGKLITQYDMHGVGEDGAGLLKFDFLGIRNLAILADAVKITKKIYGTEIDIEKVPVNDRKTFAMLARGETIGLFQLNGTGMTKYLKDLRPTTIHDINAMVALYRPGPMESIPEYIERKRNPHLITYLDPRLKDILDQSYGVITYQDDVMMIAIKLAGYSWLEADKLRKAMGKKIPEEMQAQKDKLLKGFVANGLTEKKAQQLWSLIEPFAAYGFNKAHAASYGRVAYQTSYMKANFPAAYMTAVLTAESGDVEMIAEIIGECKRMNVPILPPSINESFGGFTVVREDGTTFDKPELSGPSGKEKIRFGLYTIKNFGQGIADAIVEERKKNGKFKTIADFLDRVQDKNLNKKSLESLIKCGAMDELGERGQLLANMDNLLSYNKEKSRHAESQDSLFGLMADTSTIPGLKLAPAEPPTLDERLAWEKELLGLYISGHPLEKWKDKFDKREITIKTVKDNPKDGMTTVLAGIIQEAKDILTKKGDHMMFLTLADFTSSIEAVVFPKVFAEARAILLPDKCIAIKGKISIREGETSIIADKIKEL